MDPLSLFYIALACVAISFGTVRMTERVSGRLPSAVKTVETASREALQIVESRFEKWLDDIESRHAVTRETLSKTITDVADKSASTLQAVSNDVSRLVGQMDAILLIAASWHPVPGAAATPVAAPSASAST